MATESPVRVVTDGSVALDPQAISRLHIGVVPCQIMAGRQALTSNGATPLAQLGGQIKTGARIVPPKHDDFLQVYRRLEQSQAVSIHGAWELSGFVKSARLARNLLPSRNQVVLFEAPTIGPGLSFLVEAAAGAAERGANQRAVQLMLERIRDEGLRTIILARRAFDLLERAGARDWQRWLLAEIPGVESLFVVNPTTGRLEFVAQGHKLGASLAQRADLFRGLAHPCDAAIVHSGYERLARALTVQLPGLLGGGQAKAQPGGLDMAPYVSGSYLAIVIYPTGQAAEQIEKFARRMVRVFAK